MNAILFDLDGTLWDACATMVDSWNHTLTTEFPDLARTVTLSDLEGVMGKTMPEIAAIFFPDAPMERGIAAVAAACENEVPVLAAKGGTLYPGVAAGLRELSKTHRVGIVSNCQCGYIEAFLTAHGLADCVHGFLCEGMTHRTKGENIRQLMAELGVDTATYVGDTRGDEAAARAAGVPFIHVTYGFGDADVPDATAHSFEELLKLL